MTAPLPATMTAIEISEPGGPDVLRAVERPTPVPGAGEVLVAVQAAGVNRPDAMQREGSYPPPPGASDIPGLEVCGTVVAQGPGASRWPLGARVTALVSGGGYAQFCAVAEPQALPVPDGLDAVQAAALPETFFTVWTNLFKRGRLAPGERVLIHGGSSGIGTTAIQLARAWGARVFATAGSPDKCAACERLGAERAIDYRTEDFVAVVRGLTGGEGVDVILDMVAGDYLARNLKALRTEGRIVNIALMGGNQATIGVGAVLLKRLTITGSTLRSRSVSQKATIARALEHHVWPLLAAGRIAPVIDSQFALADAAQAHARLESGAHIGKIVLTI